MGCTHYPCTIKLRRSIINAPFAHVSSSLPTQPLAAGCRCRAADKPDPPEESSSSSSSGNPVENSSNAPSTSYSQLPWDEEQPKQLPPNYAAIKSSIHRMDNNQLQTALGVAIAAEDYTLAAQ